MIDEAYSLVLERPVGIGEAQKLYREGRLADKHAFRCVTYACECPMRLCAVDPGMDREPYFQACGCNACKTRIGALANDQRRPTERHAIMCDDREDHENDEADAPDMDRHVIDPYEILVEPGRTRRATRLNLDLPEPAAEDVADIQAPPRLVRMRSRWDLFRIVNMFHVWTPFDIRYMRFQLDDARTTASLFRRFGDLREVRLETIRGLRGRRGRNGLIPRDAFDNRSYATTRHIFFGQAKIKPAEGIFARIVFEVNFGDGPTTRTVTLNIDHADLRRARKRVRFERRLAEAGWDGARSVDCIVFVLGRLAEMKGEQWVNVIPAGSLDDVLVLPRAYGLVVAHLNAHLSEEIRLRREEHARREQERVRSKREAAEAAELLGRLAEQQTRLAADRDRQIEDARRAALTERDRQEAARRSEAAIREALRRKTEPEPTRESEDPPGLWTLLRRWFTG